MTDNPSSVDASPTAQIFECRTCGTCAPWPHDHVAPFKWDVPVPGLQASATADHPVRGTRRA